MLRDDALLERIEAGYRNAGLDERRQRMLEYVEKLTLAPSTVELRDVEAMLAAGLSEVDVLEVAEVASYYAYVNRIASGLGVELEENP